MNLLALFSSSPLFADAVTNAGIGLLIVSGTAIMQFVLVLFQILDRISRRNGKGWVTREEFKKLMDPENQTGLINRAEFGSLVRRFDSFLKERREDMDFLIHELTGPKAHQSGTPLKWTVLFIEDNDKDRYLFQRKLCSRFEFEDATTLEEGLAKLEKGHYDCVLLDLNLPDCHGEFTLREFKQRRPEALAVIVTGNSDPKLLKKANLLGYENIIVKTDDMDANDISRKINAAIIRHQSK